jgi:hypothetical protein
LVLLTSAAAADRGSAPASAFSGWLSATARIKELSRALERELGLRVIGSYRAPDAKTRAADRDEFEEARRLGHHALNKKLTGLTLAEIRTRLGDLDRARLPNVAEAKTR